jgi:hypothetical protein
MSVLSQKDISNKPEPVSKSEGDQVKGLKAMIPVAKSRAAEFRAKKYAQAMEGRQSTSNNEHQRTGNGQQNKSTNASDINNNTPGQNSQPAGQDINAAQAIPVSFKMLILDTVIYYMAKPVYSKTSDALTNLRQIYLRYRLKNNIIIIRKLQYYIDTILSLVPLSDGAQFAVAYSLEIATTLRKSPEELSTEIYQYLRSNPHDETLAKDFAHFNRWKPPQEQAQASSQPQPTNPAQQQATPATVPTPRPQSENATATQGVSVQESAQAEPPVQPEQIQRESPVVPLEIPEQDKTEQQPQTISKSQELQTTQQSKQYQNQTDSFSDQDVRHPAYKLRGSQKKILQKEQEKSLQVNSKMNDVD